jgi:hypothetical protein
MDELVRISKKAADAWRNDAAYYQAAQLIDALCDRITNGVTFATDTNVGSKWISVEDRLPEKALRCFVYQKRNNKWGGDVSLATFDPCYKGGRGNHMNGKQVWYEYDSEYGDYELSDVTHWMPTPEPPKED